MAIISLGMLTSYIYIEFLSFVDIAYQNYVRLLVFRVKCSQNRLFVLKKNIKRFLTSHDLSLRSNAETTIVIEFFM